MRMRSLPPTEAKPPTMEEGPFLGRSPGLRRPSPPGGPQSGRGRGSGTAHRAPSRRPLVRALFLAASAVLLSSVAVGRAGALANAGGRKPAQPPVVTEDFKPVIACHPNATAGQEGCGEHKVLADDAQLNSDVKVIFGLLSGAAARQDFVTAQTTWVTYRLADCKSQSDAYQGGTEQPVVYVYCLATDDTSRRQELKEFYKVLTQGLDKVPKFP